MIWIDTDGGVDDALAIAAVAKIVSERDLVFSTVFGNVSARQAAHNVSKLLQLLHIDAPIFVGADRASDNFVRYATDIHGPDGLGDAVGEVGPDEQLTVLSHDLPQFSKRRGHDTESINILSIGPATNIPLIATSLGSKRVSGITMMTGAIFDRGNITEHAEFNLYNDPDALTDVLALGVPVTIVPLDICRKVIFNREDLPSLSAFGSAEELLTEAHRFYMASYQKTDGIRGCFPHDTIALLSMMYPSKFDFWNIPFDLENSGERRGKMQFRVNGKHHARFCLGGDLLWVRQLMNSWSFPVAELTGTQSELVPLV
jgi:purine nucleosidase